MTHRMQQPLSRRRVSLCAAALVTLELALPAADAQPLPLPPLSRPKDQVRPLEPVGPVPATEWKGTTQFSCPPGLPVLYLERASAEPRDVALITPDALFHRAWVKPDRRDARVYCAYGAAPAGEGDLEGRMLAVRYRFGNELVGRCTINGPQVACETRGTFKSLLVEPTALGGR
jgi:hypothetical protein